MNYLLIGEETERLKFRLHMQEDFEEWVPLFYEKESAPNLGMDPSLSPTELCKKWFKKSMNRYEMNLGGMNVLIDKTSGRLVGQCGLLIQSIEGQQYLEVGYSILPEFWRKGYATEAAQKCRDFAFENDFTEKLISVVNTDNFGSAKVAMNNGMSIERKIDDYSGMPINLFSIKKNQWLTLTQNLTKE